MPLGDFAPRLGPLQAALARLEAPTADLEPAIGAGTRLTAKAATKDAKRGRR
jgi:hypothetical protein